MQAIWVLKLNTYDEDCQFITMGNSTVITYQSLPKSAQKEADDFIQFLATKYVVNRECFKIKKKRDSKKPFNQCIQRS